MTDYKFYLGIDPGAQGGLAWIRESPLDPVGYGAIVMPDTNREVWQWLCKFLFIGEPIRPLWPTRCVIEQVGGWTGGREGYEGNQAPGSAMFNFGTSYGSLLMALDISNIPYDKVNPNTWQAALKLRGKGGKLTKHKKFLKEKAQLLFPNLRVTRYTADALLLAHYCRLQDDSRAAKV